MAHDQRPLPKISQLNEPYFTAASKGELILQRCGSCREWIFYPRVACPHCLSPSLLWESVSGTGEIYSFAVIHRPQHESFVSDTPIVLVAVRLTEGPVIISTLAHCNSNDVRIGQKVVAVFEEIEDGLALPKFQIDDE